MCTLNIRSFTNPFHYTAIADLADVFALTETCISPNTTSAQLFDVIPRGFTFINTLRLALLQLLVAAQHFFSVNLATKNIHYKHHLKIHLSHCFEPLLTTEHVH